MEWTALSMAIAGAAVLGVIVAALVSDRRDIMRPVVPVWQLLVAFFGTLVGVGAVCTGVLFLT